jgi:hypothetical protein
MQQLPLGTKTSFHCQFTMFNAICMIHLRQARYRLIIDVYDLQVTIESLSRMACGLFQCIDHLHILF